MVIKITEKITQDDAGNLDKKAFIMFDKKFLKSKEAQSKLLLVMSYIKIYSALNGYVSFSLNFMIKKLGYNSDPHKGRINDKIIDSLRWLESNNYIYIFAKLHKSEEKVADKIKASECFSVQINFDHDIFMPKDNYVILEEDEFNLIVSNKSNADDKNKVTCDKQDLLNVFLNIKKFINFDSVTSNLCYPSHATLCNDCKISSTGAMNNIINELVSIGVLYTYNSGQYIDGKGNIKYANSFYAVKDKVLIPDICDRIIKDYCSSKGITVERFIR